MTDPARCTPTSCVHWETCARCERRFQTDEPDRDECYSCMPDKPDEWVMTKPRSLFVAVRT